MRIEGRISTFGGKHDVTDPRWGDVTQGLAMYENWEANLRIDLFEPRDLDHLEVGTFARLKAESSMYFACRFNHSLIDTPRKRRALQDHKFKISNKDGDFVMAYLTDWGPAEDTGRVLDVSPALAKELGVQTDDILVLDFDFKA